LLVDQDHALTATFANLEHTLTITATGQGTVEPSQGTYTFPFGQVVTLTVSPDLGWAFTGWSGPSSDDLVDNGAGGWELTMDRDKEIAAVFDPALYSLTLTYEGKGTVTDSPGGPYLYGQTATLLAQPAAGWRFQGWTGPDAVSVVAQGDGTFELIMDRDRSVTAVFVTYRVVLPVIVRRHSALGSH
jgi:hypothetical protein